jgi:uncharacterized protein GlcG (DUF336 family)
MINVERMRAQRARSWAVALGVVLGMTFAIGGWAQTEPLPSEKYLPLALAVEAATAAVDACLKRGYRVSATVVDRAGVARVLLRADGAGPHTADGTLRKAYTAASFRMPTSFLAEYIKSTPGAEALRHGDRLMIFGGGVPIAVGSEVIGAIAVGGAPGGDLDDVCARAGVEKIKDRLK